jgi:DNA invertase Pin-like site-specific DNA recombinase
VRDTDTAPPESAANANGRRKEADVKTKKTILYCRLSKDDGDSQESNSIQNQRRILGEYAEQNGFAPYEFAVDDGYTGTNYDRPGWQETIAGVEAGEVGAVIVKTLDRMGRNYLQTGMYREMFQERGVRLIAVSDGVDTFVRDDDFTPFREIMAEWYARDTSRKIKAVLHSKGRDGKPLTNKAPYGFVKDRNDKNAWRVDPEAAAVVRRIFALTIEGKGPYEIARLLHDEKVERPSRHLARNGMVNCPSWLGSDPYLWQGTTISAMLSRPEYAGHTANFRTSSVNFKAKKRRKNAREDWMVFPNTHEAIVTQETWDLAQKLRLTARRTDTTGEANPLTGLMFCADCGARMYNHRGKGSCDRYTCSTNFRGIQRYAPRCSGHHIATSAVRGIILDALRRTGGYAREHEDEFVELVREKSAVRQGETAQSHKRQIAKNEHRIAELEKIFRGLYEDKILGRLPPERFDEMTAGYERERADLMARNAGMQAEIDAWNEDGERAGKFIGLARRYARFEELTPAMINEFVDKIVVHESEWSERNGRDSRRGTRRQKVDVYLKYIGGFDAPDTRAAEEIEAERLAEEKLERARRSKREYSRRRKEKKRAAEATGEGQNTGAEKTTKGRPKPTA